MRPRKPVTVPQIAAMKKAKGSETMVMTTAYDAPTARCAHESGCELILVGDSVAMVVLGYDDTLQVTIDDMAHHTAAVCRVKPACLVVGDLPWMSYHVSTQETVHNAAKLIRAGAKCVKLEGGANRVPMVKALVDAEIPVMGHIGLTPQSTNAMGGFKVQGKSLEAAKAILADAEALVDAGVFAIVLEGIPTPVAKMVTENISVPTIGIGAGPHCDGQVLVFHDVTGFQKVIKPKFVRRYAELQDVAVDALEKFVADCKSGAFPEATESYKADGDAEEAIALYGVAPA